MLWTIPNHIGFVDALAAGLLAGSTPPLGLARTLVLLPNRRAVRALTEAFVRRCAAPGSNGGLLLPRMLPVGDLDEDGLDRLVAGDLPLPPAIPPLTRRLELARLVRHKLAAAEAAGAPPRSAVEALRLGTALADALDLLQAEEIAPEQLREAVAEADLAHHWQETLEFLEIIIGAWPPARDRLGGSDGGTRLAAAIDATIARWQAAPPAGPVIAAGLLATTPALARLLKAVLALPQGDVILPGLDTSTGEAAEARWEAITCAAAEAEPPLAPDLEAHPHHALKLTLARLGWQRDEVRPWPHGSERDGPAARTEQLLAAFAPASAGEGWSSPPDDAQAAQAAFAAAFADVELLEADTPAEEAQALALALRQCMETPGQTVALVTPDRALARRVVAHCRRWGLMVDDSAGQPLSRTPPATLVLAMVAALAEHFAPVALLALLKHPLVRRGEERLPWLARVRQLDLALRGVRPAPGLDGVSAHLDAWLREKRHHAPGLADWWAEVAASLAPLEALAEAGDMDLPTLSLVLQQRGEALAGDTLWAGPEGRALAARLEALALDGGIFGPFAPDEAPALLMALFADVAIRPAFGQHPRIAILGPLEAQLARADLMILAGLNEGVWPAPPRPDPWLAPAIRARLRLPGQARELGLAAADFLRALGARRVLLSRARRDAAGPLLPSRLLQRLDAHLAWAAGDTAETATGLARNTRLVQIARALDAQDRPCPAPRPRPAPPAEHRPRKLSVTEVDILIADPFAFYAKRMLKLPVLDPLDADPDAADRGQLLHKVLEDWVKDGSLDPARLTELAERMLLSAGNGFPLLAALWGPRARHALEWAGAQVLARRGQGWQPLAAEAAGEMLLANDIRANDIRLVGKADRIDRHADGSLAIIDYKTGTPPSIAQVLGKLRNQLPLLAAMASAGALRNGERPLPPAPVMALDYWRLSGSAAKPGEVRPALGQKVDDAAIATHVADTLDHVTSLITRQLCTPAPFVAQRHPMLAWGDYDHLARVQEWRDLAGDSSS
jgi:ATP-dependent helicase/nuclease subunit B